jgi:hypothetical protein
MIIQRIRDPKLKMIIRIAPFNISFEILGERGSKKVRRSLALMIFRALRETFANLECIEIQDRENKWLDFRYPFYRNFSTRQVPKIDTIQQQLGFEIRIKRLELGLTLKQLSERTKISKTYLSEIEHGKYRVKESTLEKINSALKPGTDLAIIGEHEDSSTSHDSN